MTDIHIHFPPGVGGEALALFINQLRKTLMNESELLAALSGVSTQLTATSDQLAKATNEIIVAISNAGATSPAIDAAVANLKTLADGLKATAQSLDDLNPDAAPVA